MQQLTCKMVWSLSFILFETGLNFKQSPGGKILKKCEKVWKSAKKCETVPKRFCPYLLPFSSASKRHIHFQEHINFLKVGTTLGQPAG